MSTTSPPSPLVHTVLHLTHTDILRDSRILKELDAISILPEVRAIGIGVLGHDEGAPSSRTMVAEIITLSLATKRLRRWPRPARYALNLLELIYRMFVAGYSVRPTIVHCHDTMVLPIGWLISVACRASLVYDAHELESNRNGQSRLLSAATLMIERLCWSRITLLVTVSDSIIDWYRTNLGMKDAVLVLNAPETTNADRAGKETGRRYFHQHFGITDTALVFLYIGIVGRGRGIQLILDAFAGVTDAAHVVFLGYGECEDEIRRYAERHANIHFHPPVPHAQVVSYAQDADVGLCLIENVSLSDYYCLPNKLFEYVQAGLSVLGSDFPEIAAFLRKYDAGIVCALSVDGIRTAVDALLERRPARVTADLVEVSWSTQATRLRASYARLLEQARSN